jgi:hypothetical protein
VERILSNFLRKKAKCEREWDCGICPRLLGILGLERMMGSSGSVCWIKNKGLDLTVSILFNFLSPKPDNN